MKAVVDIPVVPKLTPNTPNIAEIATAALAGGADGICAINTVGPGYTSAHGHPVLSNGQGGISGKGVLPIGLKCVREVAAVTAVKTTMYIQVEFASGEKALAHIGW